MSRIICVGHAALDRVYRIEQFPPHPTKVRAIDHVEAGGGMAANAAASIARLGGTVELWSRVGDDDAGVKIRRGLELSGVDVRYVQRFEEGHSSTSAIIVDGAGERLIVGARDVNMPSSTAWLPMERIAGASLVLADLRWLEAVRAVFQRARAEGVPTVLDADLGGREALSEILTLTDYAIFSEPALEDLLPGLEPRQRLEQVMLRGPHHVGVTRGAKGYLWLDTFGGGEAPAFKVDVADTTGAGDAFHGAFALMLAEAHPVADCARMASGVAALKCRRLGSRAGLPTRAEADDFLATAATHLPRD